MRRGVSNVGKAAEFGTPEEEVARIIAHKQNYYICLKVYGESQSPDNWTLVAVVKACLLTISIIYSFRVLLPVDHLLQVLKDSSASDIRNNYFRLSRLVHPDKCSHPQAADASAVINQAKDTLTNPMKKTLYDAYVTDVTQSGDAASEMTYAEWEAAQAAYPVKIPVSALLPISPLPSSLPCIADLSF